ncbi:MAG TPA: nucleotidyltransferase domain-containing protein [Dongiaceae bacterium]|jgi:predicted nucleotidyltransferase|nr:nucleotidyltransferase domain-containing protein [Dongiaceae bacterium]
MATRKSPAAKTRILRDTARPVGPFRNEAAALGFLRDRLVFALKPDAIWLFGSRARGDARADSDFDLLVVLPDGRPDEDYSHEAVARPVVACGLAYDIVPARWADIEAGLKIPGGIAARAIKEGRLVYQKRKLKRHTPARKDRFGEELLKLKGIVGSNVDLEF